MPRNVVVSAKGIGKPDEVLLPASEENALCYSTLWF